MSGPQIEAVLILGAIGLKQFVISASKCQAGFLKKALRKEMTGTGFRNEKSRFLD